jgi:hypothetical protein
VPGCGVIEDGYCRRGTGTAAEMAVRIGAIREIALKAAFTKLLHDKTLDPVLRRITLNYRRSIFRAMEP